MPLIIEGGANPITIKHVVYDSDANSFNCFETPDDDPIFNFELPFDIDSLPTAEFTEKVYLFKNNQLNNSSLLKLKLKEKPESNKLVGYIFTLSSLVENPSIFENIHLKRIAFNVIKNLLEEKEISIKAKSPLYRSDASYSIYDFYDEDSIIIVVCDQFVAFKDYSFGDYLPSFFKYGFRISPYQNFDVLDTDCTLIKKNFSDLIAAITVSIPKNSLHKNYFIDSLLRNKLYLKDNEVARFHLYYQVIELLLEKVFKNEVKNEVIDKFSNLSGFDIKDILRNTMTETYSLDKLVGNKYSKIDIEIIEELNFHIDNFLKYIGITYEATEVSRKIYKIRNVLFHGYSKVLANTNLDKINIDNYFKKINDSFEYLIIDLIVSYHD